MKKILALDLGDVWIGSALSDALGITCKPFETININELDAFLTKTLVEQNIDCVLVGQPITFAGRESEQTKKIVAHKNELEKKFSHINDKKIEWKLWDERLSSKRAQALQPHKKPSAEAKKQKHSLAAAFILQSYLDHLHFKKS